MKIQALTATIAATLLLASTGAATVAKGGNSPSASPATRTDQGRNECGTKRLFGRSFPIRILRGKIGCQKASDLVDRRCALHLQRQWSCLAYREDAPFVTWVPTSELFQGRPKTEVALERYPCSEARVTQPLFERPSHGFPRRRQMLADDVVRCRMLAGANYQRVIATLGESAKRARRGHCTELIYWLGPERNSYVKIDAEALLIELCSGKVRAALIFQG